MKRRNRLLIGICAVGFVLFVLSRTVWGPPIKALAVPDSSSPTTGNSSPTMDEDQRRYLADQPRHWRYIMLKR